jgi:hypothetical protein
MKILSLQEINTQRGFYLPLHKFPNVKLESYVDRRLLCAPTASKSVFGYGKEVIAAVDLRITEPRAVFHKTACP